MVASSRESVSKAWSVTKGEREDHLNRAAPRSLVHTHTPPAQACSYRTDHTWTVVWSLEGEHPSLRPYCLLPALGVSEEQRAVRYVSARAPPQGRIQAGHTRQENSYVYCFSIKD